MNKNFAWFLVLINVAAGLFNVWTLFIGLDARGFTGWTVLNGCCAMFSFAVALWLWTVTIYKGN